MSDYFRAASRFEEFLPQEEDSDLPSYIMSDEIRMRLKAAIKLAQKETKSASNPQAHRRTRTSRSKPIRKA
jgi:hypothetical protein